MIASKGVTNLSGSSCCSASCALVNIDGKILYHAVGKACTWWREAWGEAEDAVARSGRVGGVRLLRCAPWHGYGAWQSAASATATVHGKSGLALAGARQIGACLLVDELPHGALGARA